MGTPIRERLSETRTSDHALTPYPWVVPDSGVHTVHLDQRAVAAVGIAQPQVAALLVEAHPTAVTSYDDHTVRAGCGCGWFADTEHPMTPIGRAGAAEDFAAHLAEAAGRIEFAGSE